MSTQAYSCYVLFCIRLYSLNKKFVMFLGNSKRTNITSIPDLLAARKNVDRKTIQKNKSRNRTVITCISKLCVDLECCDNWPLDERSLRVFGWGNGMMSSSPSELSMLGGCSLSCGGSGNFFGNIGVSSVFSIDWNCDECLLALKSAAFAKQRTRISILFRNEKQKKNVRFNHGFLVHHIDCRVRCIKLNLPSSSSSPPSRPIFLCSNNCVSRSNSRISSIVKPYHSSCHAHACICAPTCVCVCAVYV